MISLDRERSPPSLLIVPNFPADKAVVTGVTSGAGAERATGRGQLLLAGDCFRTSDPGLPRSRCGGTNNTAAGSTHQHRCSGCGIIKIKY